MNQKEIETINQIVEFLDIDYNKHCLERIKKDYTNAYKISNNQIFFYPLNDGMPTCDFEFYKDEKLIISNNIENSEITNLDEILLEMVRLFNKSLDNKIVLDPYFFMLELTDDLKENYHGNAKLIITDKAIRNQKLNEDNFLDAKKYYINKFLDHFMGWNFGLSINRNKELKKELEELNEKVINMGIREYAGSGFEVYGTDDIVQNGLQHYYLPISKEEIKQKRIK